jgi:hypothetical protein
MSIRQTFIILLALSTGLAPTARAQTCLGLPSFSTTPFQVSGRGTVNSASSLLAAGVAYGHSSRVFAGFEAGTRSVEALQGSSLDLGANLAYRIPLNHMGGLELCPGVSLGLEVGPNNTFNSGVDHSSRTISLGVTVGRAFRTSPALEVVPLAGLFYAREQTHAESASGARLFEIQDDYALAQIGVGVIVSSDISIRPTMEVPLGLEGGDPAFGLAVGFNFGLSRIPR